MKHLNALRFVLFALMVSFFVCASFVTVARASAPFSDDFDIYSVGSIHGQGGWQTPSWTSAVVENTIFKSAPNAEQLDSGAGYNYKIGSELSSGDWYIDINPDAITSGFEDIIIGRSGGHGSIDCPLYQTYFVCNGTTFDFSGAGWHTIGFHWVNGIISANVDNGSYGATYDLNFEGGYGTVNYIQISGNAGGFVYVDNITDTYVPPVPPTIAGWDPILTPTNPARNKVNEVDLSNITESGTIQIPSLNPNSFYHLTITYLAINSFLPTAVSTIYLPVLVGGQTYSYSATTTIPVSIAGNNYFKVQYSIDGTSLTSWPLLSFDDTWVTDHLGGGAAPPSIIIPSAIQPAAPMMEDCGVYTGIDAVMCNFKNFIVGAFLPSNDALNQLSTTMSSFKNKFPMNYAAAISTTLSNIASGVNDSAAFSFALYGNSGTVNTTIFTQDLGSGVTLGGTIKLILTFLVLMVFFIWGMGYMHRIFAK